MATSIVTSSSGLLAALKTAKGGDTIALAPGSYDLLTINGQKFTDQVTITSADPAHQAVLGGISLANSSGFTFSNLELTYSARTGTGASVSGSSNIIFDGIDAHGEAASRIGNGIYIRGSAGVTVMNSQIRDFSGGLSHLDSNYITFASNTISGMSSDGIRGGGSSYVTIVGNYLTDFHPIQYAHNDAIQFWTTGTSATAHDLVISNNTIVRGAGDPVQGIFMGAQSFLPFEKVVIEGNTIFGSAYHGLSLDYVKNLTLQNNIVEGYKDMTSWIQVTHADASTVSHNAATSFIVNNNAANVVVEANLTVAATKTAADVAGKAPDLTAYAPKSIDLGSMPAASVDGGWAGDVIVGDGRANVIRGMEGADSIVGGAGDDDLNGNSGDDTVDGGAGADVVRGGQGGDLVIGGDGDDVHVNGNRGADTVHGGEGSDAVFGGQGDDVVYGDAGNDTMSGDAGADVLIGGPGADRFVYAAGGGADWILDFSAASGDRIQLAPGTAYVLGAVDNQVVIDLGGGDRLGLAGVSLANLGDWLVVG